MKRVRVLATALGFASAIAGGGVSATPALEYTLGISLQHDDNVNLSQTDPRTDNILTPNLSFSLDQQGSALTARAAGTLEYRDYLSGNFNNQLAALMSGTAAWHLRPGRLDWVFEDYVGRQPINVLASNNPDNQQQTNVFSTGPTLRARFSDALRGQLDLRYTNNYAEVTRDFNGDRFSAAGRLLYLPDPTNQISGNVQLERARFDTAPAGSDYDRGDFYVGYARQGGSIDLQGSLGYSRLDFRHGAAHGGLLADVTATFAPTPTDSLAINAANSFSDAATELALEPSQIGVTGIGSGLNGVVVSAQVYRARSLRLAYNHRTVRYRFSVAPFLRRLHYLDPTTPDQRSRGLYADFTWALTPRTDLAVFFGGENRTYLGLDRHDDDRGYGASLTWQQTRHWLWALAYSRQKRGSNVPEQSYTENVVGLSLSYRR